jgi:hypothetical protein
VKKKVVSPEVIHQIAASIDVGSRSHYVAIGQEKGDVKEFRVYDENLAALVAWLIANGITTIAMDSDD